MSCKLYIDQFAEDVANGVKSPPKKGEQMNSRLAMRVVDLLMQREAHSNFLARVEQIVAWGRERGILAESDLKTQYAKHVSEVGELGDAIASGGDIKDPVGDIFVTLVLLCELKGVTIFECVDVAWNEIKERQGQMINGTFVKD